MKIQTFNTSKKIFLIAEIGNNHEGSFSLAKKLILLAKKNGADAVKFQYIKPEKLVHPNTEAKRIKTLKLFCLSLDQFKKLRQYSIKIGIIFLSSVFDIDEIKLFSKILPAFKVASGDNDNIHYIKKLIEYKKPILISMGMKSAQEIKELISELKKNKLIDLKKLCLMHCVSNYPLENKDVNMLKINELKKFACEVGYSDHTIGIDACLVAASLGARVIEKHFTISHNYSRFRDHLLSATPKELKILSTKLEIYNEILGSNTKNITKSEEKNIKGNRRGVYLKSNLKKNHKLKFSDLIFLRPQGKLSLSDINKILGKRLKKDLNKFSEINNRVI